MPLSKPPARGQLLARLASVGRDPLLAKLAAAANSGAIQKFIKQLELGEDAERYFAGLLPEQAKAEIKELIQMHGLDSQKVDTALTGILRSNTMAQEKRQQTIASVMDVLMSEWDRQMAIEGMTATKAAKVVQEDSRGERSWRTIYKEAKKRGKV